jgi:AraC-like DNA-binding protein
MVNRPDPPENLADRPVVSASLLETPGEFADHPELGLDANPPPRDLLSELLRSVRLSGERIHAYGPLRTFSVGFAGIGTLHIVDEGEVVLRMDGVPRVEHARQGDVILLPRGDAHHISNGGKRVHSTVGVGPSDGGAPDGDASDGDASDDDAPQPARWLCGTFTIGDPQASHLLASLPAAIILRGDRGPALEGLEVARRMLLLEMEAPSQGSAVMIARILDLLFIQILRAWAAGTDAEPNWLAGALDPQIGQALSAVHRNPGHDWTVAELARVCSLSRSAFAARFVARVGMPPAAYLTYVRLDNATDMLRDTTLPVTLIAANVGYQSEAAFSRAFRRRYGMPPARWRRDMRAGHPK